MKKLLCILLVGALMLSVVGCGVNVTTDSQSGSQPTATESETSTESKVAEPGEEITLQIIDWSDSTKARREVYNQKFMEENPGVTIEYTTLPADQFKSTINSAIKAGTAPDLFPVPGGIKLSTVVEENWYQPLDGLVTQEFIDSFSPGSLNDGITTLDGKLYAVPEAANIINTLLFVNNTVLKEAGIDPARLPGTWSEFVTICDEITAAGNGNYYAMIEGGKQVNRLEIMARALAGMGGSKSNDIGIISFADGQNTLNSQPMVDALNLIDTLVKNGDFHPDTVNLSAPEARALFAQNQAAFLMQGSWCISTWRADNPDLDFSVIAPPTPDGGNKGGLPYIGAQPWMGISSNSKHPEMAAKYLTGLYSEDYQSGLVEDGGFVSAINGVNENHMTDATMNEYYTLHKEIGTLSPDPIVGNPDAALVYAQVVDISPNLGQIMQGILAGAIPNTQEALDKLAADSQIEWERAIQAAIDGGASISAADFEFKNWDTTKNYTPEDYASR